MQIDAVEIKAERGQRNVVGGPRRLCRVDVDARYQCALVVKETATDFLQAAVAELLGESEEVLHG